MWEIGKYLFLLTILMQGFNWSFGKYNYLHLEGNLLNLKTNLSVFIKNSSGMLFYAVDSEYSFLIETKVKGIMQQVSVFYKNINWNFTWESTYSCKRSIYGDVYLKFYIHLQQSEVIVGCYQALSKLDFERNENTEYMKLFPNLRDEDSNNIHIWIGNIGKFSGKGHRTYESSPIQLLGCVDRFNFNQRKFIIKENGSIFHITCDMKYIEKTWSINHFSKNEILYKMYDCDIASLNGRYCNNNIDLRNFFFENSSYIRTTFKETNFILRLDWKRSRFLSNMKYCLMEIVLKDDSLILFFVNEHNVLFENKKQTDLTSYEEIFSINVSPNTDNILLIHNDKLTLTIKVYDGEIIHISKHLISSEIRSVNIGHFKHTNSTPWFVGNIGFEYNKTIWINSLYFIEKTTTSKTNFTVFNVKYLLTIIISVIFAMLVYASIIKLLIICFKKEDKSNFDENKTRSKTPSPNHYEYDLLETNVDKNINAEIHANEYIQEENTYNTEYETIN